MIRDRIYPATLTLLFFTLLYLSKTFYRPYIYKNNIFDFYIADTFPSLLSVPSIFFFALTINPQSNNKKIYIYILTIISFIYEINSLTYDLFDIIAIIVGMLITIYVRHLLNRFILFKL